MNINKIPQIMKILTILTVLLIISNGMSQYTVGQTVANFTLDDVYGNSHSLYNYQGNIILLNFFATW